MLAHESRAHSPTKFFPHYFEEVNGLRLTAKFSTSSFTDPSSSMSQCQYQVTTSNSTVGHIHIDSGEGNPDLIYSSYWHQHPESFALSPHLPLFSDRISPLKIARHLANLLPEGLFPWVEATQDKSSPPNIATFVQACGPEPSGAFSIRQFENEAKLPIEMPPIVEQLSDDVLSERIASRSQIPFSFWHGRYYQGLAGVHDKMQVVLKGEELYLVDGSLCSTHIIKPEALGLTTPFMVANEHYCMSLAAAMQLPTAPVHIRRTPAPLLVIERFDRKWNAKSDVLQLGKVERLHTIDGCQAVGAASWEKHERCLANEEQQARQKFGVGFKRLFKLEPFFVNPKEAQLLMIRWALFNLLIGNGDAHAKNISFFQTADGLIPAPLYDLTSTCVYREAGLQEMAIGYGGAFRLEEINSENMVRFATDAGFPSRLLAIEMQHIAHDAEKHFEALTRNKSYTSGEKKTVKKIAEFVRSQIDWMRSTASTMLICK
ncbi:HipA domain-containing protein [Herbaspirillum sp. LeCh32-8]|uniref:HipA domain-containing protein n=1 Tax=Herbaspirillum sp. LeCh32-8 TaxID=2821356 RepID=UPI001AE53F38|nr:HipA domain-containing protein [Herbaspirillum sp. LeCh32-8]MBP0599161.1 HipA domain-containing protein [Herbaspirillum sp. LeCh32-8]